MKLRKGFIIAISASLVWAVTIVIYRIILSNGENPFNLTFWTTILALPYWLFMTLKERLNFRSLNRSDYLLLTLMAIVSSIGVGLAEIFALKYSPAVNFSFLIRTVTIFTIVFAYLFLRERITKQKLFLVVLLLAGSYFLTTRGEGIQLTRGDLFTLLEAMLIAFGTNVLGKKATNRMSADTVSTGRFVIAFVPLIILAVANTTIVIPLQMPLVLLITFLDFLLAILIFQAFKHNSATYMTMIMSFTPVFVSMMAIPLLGESLTPIQLVGGGLIILAGILVEKLKI